MLLCALCGEYKRCFKVLQQRMFGILLTQDSFLRRYPPVDVQTFVQDADASVRFRMVEVVTLVLEHRRLAQHGKPVRKALRNEELPVVVLRQLHGHMLPVRRASLADIHSHIQYRSFHAAHQLALRIWRSLEVQAAHHAIARHALVVLHKLYLADFLVKLPLRERFEEISSRVLENAWFDDYHALYICFDYVHLN